MKPAKILFFVDGHAPTSDDFKEAAKLSANVVFRNARAVPSEAHSLETCDGVAGKIPPLYAAKFETAENAIALKEKALSELSSLVGDEKAPKAQTEKKTAVDNTKAPIKPEDAKKAPEWNPNTAV